MTCGLRWSAVVGIGASLCTGGEPPRPPHPPGRFLCRRVLVCLGSERWCRCVERRGVVIDDGTASSRRQGEDSVLIRPILGEYCRAPVDDRAEAFQRLGRGSRTPDT